MLSEITNTMNIIERSVQVVKAVSIALEKTLPPLKQSLSEGAAGRKKITKEGKAGASPAKPEQQGLPLNSENSKV